MRLLATLTWYDPKKQVYETDVAEVSGLDELLEWIDQHEFEYASLLIQLVTGKYRLTFQQPIQLEFTVSKRR